ncbi:helix-turn-helix domain-containing protein [Streptomyces sp. NBC_01693]|uniref:helix-turn-helix domain-containing protein n=1 Tax=unclassified Streptomyces TaxID=2593676 RepID=UPI0029A3C73D|nr:MULTISPECIES: helix-turn-helix transcriptional regulator [unclassified Streptomyces]WSS77215.1 helix-turn-helix domain-containing protein [Streptomyces sp. NBC_01174]MDX3433826.1 helix-turn-helix transcriptional regulator [Streptomyces sp. ME01-18a]MDX3688637.1 helix-turn-helix transcriptional regulator [Streptomyces sp. AK04-4c]WSQ85969.1 helix-turn-helix domain-containing protein [Streptomyces sp. NBC_01212]WSR07960.1 helix-turn-helix domain-containing protein [Streptomyces sp. NBC_01208]
MTQRRVDDDADDFPEWVDRVQANVAGEVRRRRKEMGWSAQELADRCEQLGHPIPRNVIANMESGRRAGLPLVDVLVLAAALETYPACLIFPVGYVDQTQELPFERLVPTWDALRRFTGEQEVLGHDAGLVPDFEAHASLVGTALAALDEEEQARFAARTATSRAQQEEAERRRTAYADQAVSAKYKLRYLRRDLRDDGAIPPDLPPALHDVDPHEWVPDTTTEERP